MHDAVGTPGWRSLRNALSQETSSHLQAVDGRKKENRKINKKTEEEAKKKKKKGAK